MVSPAPATLVCSTAGLQPRARPLLLQCCRVHNRLAILGTFGSRWSSLAWAAAGLWPRIGPRALRNHAPSGVAHTHTLAGAAAADPPATAADPAPQASGGGCRRVLIVTGPTAVGKTEVSLRLAKQLGGEIISADSVQVYKGLDIGSDKVPVAERQGVAHHLIDVLDPLVDDFSAGHFFESARAVTEDILQRGKVPIVVGGTGLYLRWYVHGKPSTPRSDPETVQRVEEQLQQVHDAAAKEAGRELTSVERWEVAVQAVAAAGDQATADRLQDTPNNWYRLKRALEIVTVTGSSMAALDVDTRAPLDYDFRCYFLHRPRVLLYRRIDRRCEQMAVGGLFEEAATLLRLGLTADSNSATRAIGYRQVILFLEACLADPGHLSAATLVQCVRDMQSASRKFCHRQFTWFRGDDMYNWVSAGEGPQAALDEIVRQYVSEGPHQGNCYDSGRLSKDEQREMRRYRTRLELLGDDAQTVALLESVQMLVRDLLSATNEGA